MCVHCAEDGTHLGKSVVLPVYPSQDFLLFGFCSLKQGLAVTLWAWILAELPGRPPVLKSPALASQVLDLQAYITKAGFILILTKTLFDGVHNLSLHPNPFA